jgi:hypothetical protein
LCGLPIDTLAGQVTGTVESVEARASDGLVLVYINATATGKPSCATAPYWIVLNENSEAGKKQYAMLLTAKASGETVTIYGLNTCTRWGDGEDIDWITIS